MFGGLFSRTGSRGNGSAEACVMRNEPLDRQEVKDVLHSDRRSVTVETENGRVLVLSKAEARELGLRV